MNKITVILAVEEHYSKSGQSIIKSIFLTNISLLLPVRLQQIYVEGP
jgi:hypothetical protein